MVKWKRTINGTSPQMNGTTEENLCIWLYVCVCEFVRKELI